MFAFSKGFDYINAETLDNTAFELGGGGAFSLL